MGTDRFTVLDSWRGICAYLVVIHHFPAFSHLFDLPMIRNSYLFVDFFFCLSGFVIAANYQDRLTNAASVGAFLWRRIARLYPLHLFMLVLFIAWESFKYAMPGVDSGKTVPFVEPNSPAALVAHLTLTQSLHLFGEPSFNGVAWSISVEMWTYVLFALAVAYGRRHLASIAAAVLVLTPMAIAALSPAYMYTTVEWGMLRCVLGFCAGAVAFDLYRRYRPDLEALLARRGCATTVELIVGLMVVGLVGIADRGPLTILTTFVFALAVFVFAFERGAVSRVLTAGPFRLAGRLSYSIYMTHMLILYVVLKTAELVAGRADLDMFTPDQFEERFRLLIGVERWQGDLATLAMLIVVGIASYVTYRLVERPGQAFLNGLARRRRASSAAALAG